MKLILRFFLPLLLTLSTIAYLTIPAVEYIMNRWFMRDIEARSKLIADVLQHSLSSVLPQQSIETNQKKLAIIEKMTENERILAIGYCDSSYILEFRTKLFPDEIECKDFIDIEENIPIKKELQNGTFYVTSAQIPYEIKQSNVDGNYEKKILVEKMLIVHDMSFAARRTEDSKKYLFILFLCIGIITSVFGVLIARWSMHGWIRSVRNLVIGAQNSDIEDINEKEFIPILQDVKSLIRELEANRITREDLQITWTAETLKEILTKELAGNEVIIVSNREPYIHIRENNEIKVIFPASGLVTAMEPIVRACSGIWVAHGQGTADKEVVDKNDRISVPPGKDEYEIHRIWLTKEEEDGYYYGFSNEGLWPLCHIAHTRPIFRQSDWEQYKLVNQKFADAVIADAKSDSPVILVQDYHFALLPKMIRAKLPDAIIITFWHIPWPNSEAFGICPWREEILDGLLGSSIMGFHIQFHRNNFVETVDRFLESRIDRESSSISYLGRACLVRSYPISIEWPPRLLPQVGSVIACTQAVSEREHILPNISIGLGVDRLDYTKGIIERFRAVERFLEKYPQWVGKFSFIQIAAPSRSSIPAYKAFEEEVRSTASGINEKFALTEGYLPIILRIEHHGPELVYEYMKAANLCFVSSLHDGMNLVAKEYVAARDDELGVLILSMFAGASRELTEALIINPYDMEQCADALHLALSMSIREQHERMHAMRSFIKEFNIYRWAGKMLLDAARIKRKNRFTLKFSKTINNLSKNIW